MEKKHRKIVRKEQRIAARVTEELFQALQEKAYLEQKACSTVVVEALVKYLDFRMPLPPKSSR